MSQDIRSYFSRKNDDCKSKSQEQRSDSAMQRKRHHRVIESDDDDDDLRSSSAKKKQKESEKNDKKEVTVKVENYFGNTPVLQKKISPRSSVKKENANETSASAKPKRVSTTKRKKDSADDSMYECDDELEASLLQTDEEQLVSTSSIFTKKENGIPPKQLKKSKNESSPKKDSIKFETNRNVESQIKTPQKRKNFDVKKELKTPRKEKNKQDSGPILNSDQKKKNSEAYQKYLNRSGPKNPGSKNIPKGTPTCLQGLTFVITGVLDSLERNEAVELIQKCGGRVTGQVSRKTNFVIIGEEPGASKIQKADQFKTEQINEDQLLNLIQLKSECKGSAKDEVPQKITEKKKSDESNAMKTTASKKKSRDDAQSKSAKSKEDENFMISKEVQSLRISANKSNNVVLSKNKDQENESAEGMEKKVGDMLWVEKYKPKSTKNIVGQTGEKSNAKKLMNWLQNWHKNHLQKGSKKSSKPAPWAHNDDGSYYKACLLSGPPGVGKTTTVHLVCKELGLDIIEFNASDTRSKRHLQEEVSELLSTKSIRGFFQGVGESCQNHVLVMDEVDGMAGNEDRGGIQELIQLIKNTRVPIIGICNDRNHQKMRTLVNYCFDLRFQRPRLEQIKGAMKSICFKENFNIANEALEEIIAGTNHDIRQVLHHLSLLASGNKTLSAEEARKNKERTRKPLNLSPWDVVRKVFSASEQEKMSFSEKSDLFFQDYSLGPLFVQDSYLRVKPYKAKNCEKKKLELISNAADSLALGDVVEKTIRSQNSWNLLPVQAVFSSVLPGHYMSGHIQGQVQFPVWLGKNSRRNKLDRLLQELHSSLRLSVTGTKGSVNLDYLDHIKRSIVRPLVKEKTAGVSEALKFMMDYKLTREDLDHVLELSSWPGFKDSFSEVDSKVKASLTRALNKECQAVSHSIKRSSNAKEDDRFFDEGEEEDLEEENDNVDSDPMIKKGKPKKGNKEESANQKKNPKKESTGEKRKGKQKK